MTAPLAGSVSLRWLLEPWSAEPLPDIQVHGLALDSRRLRHGEVFVALAGEQQHGAAFIPQAAEQGAAAVVWDPEDAPGATDPAAAAAERGLPAAAVPGLRRHLGAVAARLYGEPSRSLEVIAVTGTDGKSSVSHFVAQLLAEPDRPWGVIGTLGHGLLGALQAGELTTPDAASVQRALAECRAAGAAGVALEASSHALAQGRLASTAVDVAVLTHLGRDHIDYHGSLEAYADAKGRLFEQPSVRAQVLNIDDALGQRLWDRASGAVFTYSPGGRSADLAVRAVVPQADGLRLELVFGGRHRPLHLPLIGAFNAANALAALAACVAAGRPLDALLPRLEKLHPVPGRMERFQAAGAPLVVVDYAHTPGALEQALEAVRAHTRGRLAVVFGCGGDRDRGKRALMGEAAARLADRVWITDDNPRSEDPAAIRAEVRGGTGGGAHVTERAGRAEAIAAAIAELGPDDALLVAGKGHESAQEIAGQRHPFSDREQVARALGREEGAWIR